MFIIFECLAIVHSAEPMIKPAKGTGFVLQLRLNCHFHINLSHILPISI